MNQKLRELAEQAGLKTEIWNNPEPFVIYKEDVHNPGGLQKFAELIIQECVDRLRLEGELGKIQLVAGPSGMYKLAFMNEAANIIKEHFEIE